MSRLAVHGGSARSRRRCWSPICRWSRETAAPLGSLARKRARGTVEGVMAGEDCPAAVVKSEWLVPVGGRRLLYPQVPLSSTQPEWDRQGGAASHRATGQTSRRPVESDPELFSSSGLQPWMPRPFPHRRGLGNCLPWGRAEARARSFCLGWLAGRGSQRDTPSNLGLLSLPFFSLARPRVLRFFPQG